MHCLSAGDAVEMGVGLESFEKRATAFGRFNASPDCLGTHSHTHTMGVLTGQGRGRGRGLGETGRGEGEGAKLARAPPSRRPGDGERALGPQATTKSAPVLLPA